MVTLLTETGQTELAAIHADHNDLWLPVTALESTTGWTLRPEGFCKGDTCVPIPAARQDEFVRGNQVNAAALWRHLKQPLLRDASADIWLLGEGAAGRAAPLRALQAPDFTLPDLAGNLHSLSEQRGKKVLLVTWASW